MSLDGLNLNASTTDGDDLPKYTDSGGRSWVAGLTAYVVSTGTPDVLSVVTPTTGLPVRLADGSGYLSTLPVSLASVPSHAVTGPLTDTELRASAVPVSGTFYQATQPVSIAATVTVSGTVDLGATDNAVLDAIAASAASTDTKTPALGQALAAGSVPVVLTAAQLSTLTPPGAITGYLTESDFDTKVGSLTETAPATDTASSGLNGRLQRIAQRLTSLLGLLPSALTGSGNFKVAVQEALPAGANAIGSVEVSSSALPTGAATATKQDTIIAGLVSIDGHIDGVEGSLTSIDAKITAVNTGAVVVASSALPTGAATAARQDTGNTSLASIDTKTPALGQALAAASVPVVLTAAQITTLTPPAAITGFATETTLSTLNGKVTACNTGAVVLAAGTAAIGKLTANSGVTIGAVEIAAAQTIAVTNAGTFAVQVDGAALTSLQLLDDAVATTGSAITTKGFAVSGTDGTNARVLKTDSSGELQVDVLTLPTLANVTTVGTVSSVTAIANALPAGNNNIGDVDVASIAAGTNYIGRVRLTDGATDADVFDLPNANVVPVALVDADGDQLTSFSVVQNSASGLNATVVGNSAHDASDSGNAVKVGARAAATLSDDTPVANGDRTDNVSDLDGAVVVRPQFPLGDLISEAVSDTGGSSTAFTNFGATASTRNYVTAIHVFRTDAGTSVAYVDFRDGTGGSVLYRAAIPPNGGAVITLGGTPLFRTSANTALAYDVSAALTTVYITVSGFKSKV